MRKQTKIAIIGGGAAGFFAAINAAQVAQSQSLDLDIRIFESSSSFLKKVKISGGGRCNVTHNCFDVSRFCQNYPRGGKALLSPMQRFQAKDTVQWFKERGVHLVAEDDGRMFPDTNTSDTIINCYLEQAQKLQIQLETHSAVKSITALDEKKWSLSFKDKESFTADFVLVATGSSPGGYQLAESTGHTITERAPSLFSFKIQDPLIEDLQGLSFADTSLKLNIKNSKALKQSGPTLITHWGLSGPAILKLSAWAAREMKQADYKGQLIVNWVNSIDRQEIESTLLQLKKEQGKSLLKNIYPQVLPKRFWINLLNKLSIPQDKQWANLTKKELNSILQTLTQSEMTIIGQNRFKDEFVECGGVNLKEVNFKTMESKICPGLYFAGELLDIDGITGGFNFQNAWTTGWIAAQDMIEKAQS